MSSDAITPAELELFKEYLGYNPVEGYLFWNKGCGSRGVKGKKILSKSGKYYRFKLFGKSYLSHRVAFCLYYNRTLCKNEVVDHKDLDTLNMRINNLRFATESQNRVNSKPKPNKLNEPNISLQYDRYRVTIRIGGKRFNQAYRTLEQAKKVRDEMKAKLSGEFLCQ